MNLIQLSAWLAPRWLLARRHSWERTSEPHGDGSDQPKIGDITGEAELGVVTLRNVFCQSSVLKPRSTLAKISSGWGPG